MQECSPGLLVPASRFQSYIEFSRPGVSSAHFFSDQCHSPENENLAQRLFRTQSRGISPRFDHRGHRLRTVPGKFGTSRAVLAAHRAGSDCLSRLDLAGCQFPPILRPPKGSRRLVRGVAERTAASEHHLALERPTLAAGLVGGLLDVLLRRRSFFLRRGAGVW